MQQQLHPLDETRFVKTAYQIGELDVYIDLDTGRLCVQGECWCSSAMTPRELAAQIATLKGGQA